VDSGRGEQRDRGLVEAGVGERRGGGLVEDDGEEWRAVVWRRATEGSSAAVVW
jgi:hypothetical protein